MAEVLTISDRDGVRTLTLNRPESFNSLTVELKEALLTALEAAGTDDAVRAVVLTGAGKAFCAGQDLKEHLERLEAGDPAPLATVDKHYNPIVTAITTLPKPIIAAVNGMAAGAGASFAYACDLRIAAESTKFLMAFAGVGLTADSGSAWTLPRLIGYGRAMELFLLARPVAADEALRIGMVNQVVPAEEVLTTAHALATRLAAGPTTAYAKIKEAMLASAGSTLADGLAVEGRTQAEAGATEDHREGVAAFVAKRPPVFTGR
ncbi:enoyl-CoA hydratase-related protein [Actinokineospora globicatena]|uniref:enoyl-CoA hydratase-related protein n=1 Tax=Actinokineospora globicatena TaxID=103729 RepID=UPI0020A4553D|nr:enoyl-CoA hydratase-related protein [Actinokineospora globicatena]MCP2300457.1 Enoyl-CoA hydratase [Actinokineospora globicatena]GLW80991.1 enoyl-CoA hydratase [Actinokineospora globicatena]GLW88184.1 enoyl-CoA hydratase [Actinokineospora globicatena]